MKKLLLLFVSLIFLFGCEVSQKRVPWADLEFSNDGKLILYKGAPFSGIMFDTHPNGELWVETYYTDGKVNGTTSTWYENGQIQCLNHFVNGCPKHLFTEKKWYESGELQSKGTYINPNGNLLFGGTWEFYYKNGSLKRVEEWENGLKQSENCWGRNNTVIDCRLIIP